MAIDAEWVMWEFVDNHRIARYQGNIPASNNALKSLMIHVNIDAVAKQRVEVSDGNDEAMMQRLREGRLRAAGKPLDEAGVAAVMGIELPDFT
jgi:hypothetical protein